jgi:hypothetical protein
MRTFHWRNRTQSGPMNLSHVKPRRGIIPTFRKAISLSRYNKEIQGRREFNFVRPSLINPMELG